MTNFKYRVKIPENFDATTYWSSKGPLRVEEQSARFVTTWINPSVRPLENAADFFTELYVQQELFMFEEYSPFRSEMIILVGLAIIFVVFCGYWLKKRLQKGVSTEISTPAEE